ncbi:hypothetical protein HPB51_012518 [Rhipicephalus microplus]|uniref:Uncharacterized protein n=1 Tax=Rhipicephalus microplus TaxID=6941 RepID=A0A9J6DGI0_RHIMP|nr:hypothetical protein HPB51_012518 [Rhipicephalus microplus]
MGKRAHSLPKMARENQYPALSQHNPSERHPKRGRSRSRSGSRQRNRAIDPHSSSSAIKRSRRSRSKSRSRSRSRTGRNSSSEPSFSSGNGQPPPGGKPKRSCKVTWSHLAAQESRSTEENSLPEDLGKTLNSPIGMRLEKLDKENRELRDELSRARQGNEKSAKKIDELQKTLNKILKHMTGHAGGAPTQRVPMEHSSAVAEREIDMLA